MPRKILIASPEEIPAALSDDPEVLVVDPAMVPAELMHALDECCGGLLSAEGALEEWASEEEAEHGMGDDEEEVAGFGDDEDEEKSAEGDEDEDDEEKSAEGDEDEDEDEDDDEERKKGGLRGKFRARGGRGKKGIPPLAIWARRSLAGR